MNTRSVLRIGAIGAAVSVLMLVAIAVIVAPFGFADPTEEILTGQEGLSSTKFDRYIAILPALYAIDSIFIVGWIVGWVGVAALVRTRNELLGRVALAIGLIGPILDFTENEIAWALIDSYRQGISVPVGWYLGWRVVRQLSYLIPYAAATVAAVGLWSQKSLDRVVTGVGTVLVAVAIMGAYVSALSLVAYLWWLVWFICISALLWRRAAELPVNGAESLC
ncbi:MAG: hypothetical protein GY832_34050 [Chloroflexi bacterium]|nr:hypothetical protein [Chloroflexota bacterium]